jgi:CRP-like cAMP-binding protein
MATSAIQDKIHAAFSSYPKRSYPKGQILVFADESPEHIFYIVEGRVRKYDVSYRGEEVIVNIFKPPAFFPMSWAINHAPNKFFYKTETDTEIHVVPASVALQLLEDNPDITLDLLSRIYRGMDGLLGRVVHLMSGTAKSRLLYELIIEARRFGEEQPDGTYKLTSNESDLAARSGLTRETISREMRKLKESGWVELQNNVLLIKNLPAMQKALGMEI